jgi:hypothetical protein
MPSTVDALDSPVADAAIDHANAERVTRCSPVNFKNVFQRATLQPHAIVGDEFRRL